MMKFKNPIILTVVFVLVILSFYCSYNSQQYVRDGFYSFNKSFRDDFKTSTLNMTIELDKVTIHIVGDRKFFDWDVAVIPDSKVLGYARQNNHIWLFGYEKDGVIYINQAILGHEMNHLLNFNNNKINNPDNERQ